MSEIRKGKKIMMFVVLVIPATILLLVGAILKVIGTGLALMSLKLWELMKIENDLIRKIGSGSSKGEDDDA